MARLSFKRAEAERIKLTAVQQKQIKDLYKQAAEDIAKQAEKAPRVPSDVLRKQYLNKLQEQINEQLIHIQKELNEIIPGNMKKTADAVVRDNLKFTKEVGLHVEGAFSHVPDEIVRTVISGQLYEGNWHLSQAIWAGTRKTESDIRMVIAKGIAENKSTYDIAKDLEKYVNPSARKDWNWSKVYPGTAKKVDYSAQRLARTMVSHAYQQAFVKTTQKNPFVEEYIWDASNSSRVCELCASRDGQHYKKDDLPLDHPNGMCTFTAYVPDSMTEIADRIADWAQGNPDSGIDAWVESMKK